MFFSYLFDNGLEDLDELSTEKAFILLSQDGYVRCIEKDARVRAAIEAHIERGTIKGDRYSGCHFFLISFVLACGQQSVESLLRRLTEEIPFGSTYHALLTCQKVINTHIEQAIATLIDDITDDDHLANANTFERIADNYGVLSKFNPQKYMQESVDWRRKAQSYRQAFCREPELVNVTLR